MEETIQKTTKTEYPHLAQSQKEVIIKRIDLRDRNNLFGDERNSKAADFLKSRCVYECLNDGVVWKTGLTDAEEEMYSKLFREDLSKYNSVYNPHPFYSKRENKLDVSNTLILNSKNPREYVKIRFAQQIGFIAPSLAAFKQGKHPNATHYIFQTEVEEKAALEKTNRKTKSFVALDGMSVEQLRTVIEIYKGQEATTISESNLKLMFEQAAEENISRLFKIIEETETVRDAKSLIIRALSKEIVNELDGKYYYQDQHIGNSLDSTADFLNNEENSTLRLKIEAKVKNL